VLREHPADRLDADTVPVLTDVVHDHLSRRSSSAAAKNARGAQYPSRSAQLRDFPPDVHQAAHMTAAPPVWTHSVLQPVPVHPHRPVIISSSYLFGADMLPVSTGFLAYRRGYV
jgi:hypothetical protein